MIGVLRPICYGIITKNKDLSSRVVTVKVLDLLPNLVGTIDNEVSTLSVNVTTADGEVTHNLSVSDIVPATWLNRNTNRITAPDVQYGERVLLWQDGDSRNYYWETLDIDNHLRQLETVIFAFSNTNANDRTSKTLNLKNCYYMEFNTNEKRIRLRTNKNDSEPFAYDLLLDTKLGNFRIVDDAVKVDLEGDEELAVREDSYPPRETVPSKDDGVLRGNKILLDSANTLIELLNVNHTTYRLEKKNIHEECLGNRFVTVGGNNTIHVKGDESYHVEGSRDTTIDVNDSLTIKGTYTFNVTGVANYTYGSDHNSTTSGTMNVDVSKATFSSFVDIGTKVTVPKVSAESVSAKSVSAKTVSASSVSAPNNAH